MARIYKRGRTWWIDYGVAGGFRRRESLHTRKKEIAQEALAVYERRAALGEEDARGAVKQATFAEFADLYMELKAGAKAASTIRRNVEVLKHLVPHFGRKLLNHITREDIAGYTAARRRVIAPTTVNTELSLFRAILNAAIEWNYLGENPAKGVMLPEEEKEPVFLQPHEVGVLLEAARGQMRSFIVTAVSTGFRRGELFDLTWKDVRFDQRQVLVPRAKGRRFRAIPMNDLLYETLRDHPHHRKSPYVFHNPDGSPWHDVRGSFYAALERAGLPRIRFHDLRHTFVSNLVIAGVDLRQVQELAGHRDIRTTMRYAHLAPGRGLEAVQRLVWDSPPPVHTPPEETDDETE